MILSQSNIEPEKATIDKFIQTPPRPKPTLSIGYGHYFIPKTSDHTDLRIDNSRHSVICTFGLTSGTMSCTLTYYMSKNRAHFFPSDDVNDIFVRFDFIQILV